MLVNNRNYNSKAGLNLTIAIILLVLLALTFDFLNGFHDSANSVATVVSTKSFIAKMGGNLGCIFNFVCFPFFGLHVAGTIGEGNCGYSYH